MHDQQPDTKVIIRVDEEVNEADMMESVDSIRARRQDEEIVCKAVPGKNLHDFYSGARIRLAIERQSVERLNQQMLGVDVMEVFSPERVGKL